MTPCTLIDYKTKLHVTVSNKMTNIYIDRQPLFSKLWFCVVYF